MAQTPKMKCGCWTQPSRCDTKARNMVLKQSFYFKESNFAEMRHVIDFTSLKWSRLLFEEGNILSERDDLQHDLVFSELQVVYRQVLTLVNKKGGWTMVGWFKRGSYTDEEKQETDTDILSENIKINVSHLTPTKLKHTDLKDVQLKHSKVMELLQS